MSRTTTIRLLYVYCVAGVLATLAFYWDEVWHTDRGRDSFWIPPHQMLYGSVAGILIVVAVWSALLSYRGASPRALVRYWPLALAFAGTAVTLLDAPIDGVWHNWFGRDAVFWSPPHVLAVAGLTTAAAGMLLLASGVAGWIGDVLTVVTAALVMAAQIVLVMEYESDVPQFATLWYLPVVALTACFTLGLAGAVSPLRWLGTLVSLTYALIMAAVVIFLSALGHSTPLIPVIAIAGVVYDLALQRGLPLPARVALYISSIYLTYALYLNNVLGGVRIEARDIVLGLPPSILIAWGVLALIRSPGPVRRIRPSTAAATAAVVLALLPMIALAHDPGQGPKVGMADLEATRDGRQITVNGRVTEPAQCDVLTARGLVARRARHEVRAPLTPAGNCTFTGTLQVTERGRWFVYLELNAPEGPVEVWLPVIAGDGQAHSTKTSWIYIPPKRNVNAVALVSGTLIYALSLALFGSCIVAFRRTREQRRAGLPELQMPATA